MNRHQKLRLLRDHGFREDRLAKHGTFWIDPYGNRVMVQRPGNYDPRAEKNWMAELSRIIKERPAATKPPGVEAPKPFNPLPAISMASPKPEKTDLETGNSRGGARKSYDPETEDRVNHLVTKWIKEGKNFAQVAQMLRDTGIRTPMGCEYHEVHVINRLKRIQTLKARSRSEPSKPEAAPARTEPPKPERPPEAPAPVRVDTPRASPRLPDAVSWILLDDQLSDTQKVAMIRAWAGL